MTIVRLKHPSACRRPRSHGHGDFVYWTMFCHPSSCITDNPTLFQQIYSEINTNSWRIDLKSARLQKEQSVHLLNRNLDTGWSLPASKGSTIIIRRLCYRSRSPSPSIRFLFTLNRIIQHNPWIFYRTYQKSFAYEFDVSFFLKYHHGSIHSSIVI